MLPLVFELRRWLSAPAYYPSNLSINQLATSVISINRAYTNLMSTAIVFCATKATETTTE